MRETFPTCFRLSSYPLAPRLLYFPRGYHFSLLCFLSFALITVGPVGAVETAETAVDSTFTESTTLAPPDSVRAADHEYDNGEQVDINWELSADDVPGGSLLGYNIYRQQEGQSLETLGSVLAQTSSFADNTVKKDQAYNYSVSSFSSDAESQLITSGIVTPDTEWFDGAAGWEFVLLILICGSVIYFIYSARRGKKYFLRKIAGLQAIEEAIGRATEMGRPILFIPGIHDMDDVQTIAGMTILAHVAKQVAEYESRIVVPTRASLAMTAARETVREAYITAGRMDAYRQDDIFYVSDEQFAYVAAVNGIMVRDKPATCFYLGAFFAESLILAETGNSIGAIQIAGTAMPAQLPFFVAACDYTLIGEELFAASAYLSGEAKQLGSLKGQDLGKAVAMAAITIGTILFTLGDSEYGLWPEVFGAASDFITSIFRSG